MQIPSDPCYLGFSHTGRYGKSPATITDIPSGRFVFFAHYLERIMVHRIDNKGSLESNPIEDLQTPIAAHCFQTDPSNRFAYVPHIDNRGGANAIFQFNFDAVTGKLKKNSPPPVTQKTGDGPRYFCMHTSLDVFYFSNGQGSSISTYNFDKTTGQLPLKNTIRNLPKGWSGQNKCSQIRLTPDG